MNYRYCGEAGLSSRSQNQNDSSDEELNTKLNGFTIRTLYIGEENTKGKMATKSSMGKQKQTGS